MRKIKVILISLIALGILFEVVALSANNATKKIDSFIDAAYIKVLKAELGLASSKEDAIETVNRLIAHYDSVINTSSSRAAINYAKEEKAELKLRLKEQEIAIQLAREVLSEYPESPTASKVIGMLSIEKARQLTGESKYDEAIIEYQNLIDSDVAEIWKACAINLIAYNYLKMGQNEEALETYQSIIDNYPNLYDWRATAQCKIGRHYENIEKDLSKAKEAYQKVIDNYPYSGWVNPAKEKLKEWANE